MRHLSALAPRRPEVPLWPLNALPQSKTRMAERPAPIEHLPATEPWLRLPRETSKAYQHFVKYREMDVTVRSIRLLAVELGRSPDQLYTWSQQWRWVERVRAWDDHLEETGRQAQLDKVKKAAELRVDVVLHGLQAIHDRLVGRDGIVDEETGEVIADKVQALDLNRLDAKDVAALGNVLAKFQGMAEEAAGVRVHEPTKVDVRLSFDLDSPAAVGHRVVESQAQRSLDPAPAALEPADPADPADE